MTENKVTVDSFILKCKGKFDNSLVETVLEDIDNEAVVESIFWLLQHESISKSTDMLLQKLFDIFMTDRPTCRVFTLQFLPQLIWMYFDQLHEPSMRKASCRVETILLAIYNQAAKENLESPYKNSFRIPSISQPSIYHSANVVQGKSSALTEQSLNRHDRSNTPVVMRAPVKQLDRINAASRMHVLNQCLKEYNKYLTCFPRVSLESFCRTVIRISCCGATLPSDLNLDVVLPIREFESLPKKARVNVSGEMVTHLVTGIHFVLNNGLASFALAALECLHNKSVRSLCARGVLSTQALRDLVRLSAEPAESFFTQPPLSSDKLPYRNPISMKNLQKTSTRSPTPSNPTIIIQPSSLPVLPRPAGSPTLFGEQTSLSTAYLGQSSVNNEDEGDPTDFILMTPSGSNTEKKQEVKSAVRRDISKDIQGDEDGESGVELVNESATYVVELVKDSEPVKDSVTNPEDVTLTVDHSGSESLESTDNFNSANFESSDNVDATNAISLEAGDSFSMQSEYLSVSPTASSMAAVGSDHSSSIDEDVTEDTNLLPKMDASKNFARSGSVEVMISSEPRAERLDESIEDTQL